MKLVQEKMVIGLGIWLIVLPFTGFPSSWKTFLIVLTGLVLAYVGALLFKNAKTHHAEQHAETRTDTFTETV